MKVVSAQTMSELESQAYQEGCLEDDFMEKAGFLIGEKVEEFWKSNCSSKNKHILLFCGKGNNGGDTFVAGRYLIDKGYKITAIKLEDKSQSSPLCQKNEKIFLSIGGFIRNTLVQDYSDFSLILDGIFGTGFKGNVKEPYASLIQSGNLSKLPILAVDIPSGLNGTTGEVGNYVISATQTIFLGLPKTGFFLQNGWNYVGKLIGVDFGLPPRLVDQCPSVFELINQMDVSKLIPPIQRNRHKYQAGQVIGLAGSKNMPGAALLSSLAALRGGCGMMRLLFPNGMEAELSASPFEIIKIPYSYDIPQEVVVIMNKGAATFVGPGLSVNPLIGHFLKQVMPHLEKPCVIDADALSLYSENAFELPKKVIFTPHTGEMEKLLHSPSSLERNLETLDRCQKYAEEKNITLLLKGAPTFIFHPHAPILVNTSGNPGMATAGSGDVLTGLLASLLAQGLGCREAAALGTYLHGLSGEFAAIERTSHSMIASDLIAHLNDAYKQLDMSA